MIKKIFFFFLALAVPFLGLAAGTTSAILGLNPLAYDAGLDIACYAGSESLENLVYNPAGGMTGHAIGLSGGVMGLDMNYFSLAYNGRSPFSRSMSLGALVKYMGTGSVDGLDENGAATGSISPSDLAVSAIAGWQINKQIGMGTRIYVVQEKMSDKSTGYGFDLGASWKMNLMKNTSFRAGLTALNVYSRLWDITEPVGLGAGLLFDTEFSGMSGLEYGLGLKMDKDEFFEAGGGVRFSSRIKLGTGGLDYKIGAGYYYSDTSDALQGLRAGLLLGFLKNFNLGYDLLLRPWGTENRISVSYNIQ
ncbi:MAG: hypothetical protein PHF84_11285 [bacterium]|nr:hypothetical protein [bacterium]